MRIFLLILFGVLGGVLGGMGMGGGTLLVPLLTLFGGVSQQGAQAINLVTFIPMSAVALAIHVKHKLVRGKTALGFVLPALITSALAALLALKTDGAILRKAFGAFLILLGAGALTFETVKRIKERKRKA